MTQEVSITAVPASALTVGSRDIERALGYGEIPAPEYLPAMIADALATAQGLLDIRCGYRVYAGNEFALSADDVVCRSVCLHTGRIIATRLRGSTALAVFVATIGVGIETASARRMADGEMMEGFLLDTIGSVYAEAAAEWTEAAVSALARADDAHVTNRYSPGYCEWFVREQRDLFSLLPEGTCGITLTPSALMLPIKSVSGIIGIGATVRHEEYQCSLCDMQDCIRTKLTDARSHSTHLSTP